MILLPQAPSILCEMKMGDVLVSQNKDLNADPSTHVSSQHVLVGKLSTGGGGGASG